MKKLLTLLLVSILVFAFAGVGNASDEDWPTREIRIVVPYGEGGASHRTSMLVKKIVEEHDFLDEPIIVSCMSGANTLQGQREVLNADPNGYTILAHHNAMLNSYALGKQDFTYTDFKQVAQVFKAPIMLAARDEAPYDDAGDLVNHIKNNPGEIQWTWSHLGGNTHFNSYLFFDAANIEVGQDIYPVVTSGGAQSAQYLAGKETDVAMELPSSFAEYIEAGEFKALGQSGSSTMTLFGKEIKSFKEQGINYTYMLRFLFHVPKGTPDHIVTKLENMFRKVVNTEEFQNAMEEEMQIAEFLPSEEAREAFAQEGKNANKIGEMVKKAMEELE